MTELEKAIRRLLEKNPGAKPLFKDLDVVWTSPDAVRGNWAEFHHKDEPGPPGEPNPYQGKHTIALNQERVGAETDPAALEEIILGEAMHLLPETFPAEYGEFVSGSGEPYLEAQRRRYEQTGDPRDFEKWLKYSGHDALIRGALLSEMPTHKRQGWGGLLSQFPFSKEQFMALGDIKRRLKKKK